MTTTLDLIVKFGGSAITHKESLETVNKEGITAAVNIVSEISARGLSCILVHGAGSFGHHQAKHFKLTEGYDPEMPPPVDKRIGVCQTRRSVCQLNGVLVNALVSADLPVVGVSAIGSWTMKDGVVARFDILNVETLVKHKYIPLLHGDVVMDEVRGCSILSGDTIIQTICDACDVGRVVFLSDVDGIYNKPPLLHNDARLLKTIYVNQKGLHTNEIATDVASCDVTGGINKKLKCASAIVLQTKDKSKVMIGNLFSPYAANLCIEQSEKNFNRYKCTQIIYKNNSEEDL